jgi:cell division septation protein DedD
VLEEKSWDSAFPKIVTTALAVFLIGFLLWWLYLTKSTREDVDRPVAVVESVDGRNGERAAPGSETTVAEEDASESDTAADTLTAASGLQRKPSGEAEQVVEGQTTTPMVREDIKTDSTKTVGSTSAPADLARYAGKYLIHVSSFRGASRVRVDSDYLTGSGYDIVVARVDLGSKGLWYRIYVGPFETRSDATNTKIRLDENPRFRSTRITRVPSNSVPDTES